MFSELAGASLQVRDVLPPGFVPAGLADGEPAIAMSADAGRFLIPARAANKGDFRCGLHPAAPAGGHAASLPALHLQHGNAAPQRQCPPPSYPEQPVQAVSTSAVTGIRGVPIIQKLLFARAAEAMLPGPVDGHVSSATPGQDTPLWCSNRRTLRRCQNTVCEPLTVRWLADDARHRLHENFFWDSAASAISAARARQRRVRRHRVPCSSGLKDHLRAALASSSPP